MNPFAIGIGSGSKGPTNMFHRSSFLSDCLTTSRSLRHVLPECGLSVACYQPEPARVVRGQSDITAYSFPRLSPVTSFLAQTTRPTECTRASTATVARARPSASSVGPRRSLTSATPLIGGRLQVATQVAGPIPRFCRSGARPPTLLRPEAGPGAGR